MGNLGPGSEEVKEVLSIPNYLVCTVSRRGEINLEGGAELERYTCGARANMIVMPKHRGGIAARHGGTSSSR